MSDDKKAAVLVKQLLYRRLNVANKPLLTAISISKPGL